MNISIFIVKEKYSCIKVKCIYYSVKELFFGFKISSIWKVDKFNKEANKVENITVTLMKVSFHYEMKDEEVSVHLLNEKI